MTVRETASASISIHLHLVFFRFNPVAWQNEYNTSGHDSFGAAEIEWHVTTCTENRP
jgi:hypothetical protein